jgi:acetolactate synthase I/II/III large subunit
MEAYMNGADLLIKALQDHGVDFVATLCGNGLNPFLVACQRAGLTTVDTRNEQAASYAADAYARLTGKLGVCAVSSGVAHVNALAGVVNAYYDGAPMLLITGASATPAVGRGPFQELDQPALAEPVCKLSRLITDVDALAFQVGEAIATACAGRPGPVHLTIPLDVLNAPVEKVAAAVGAPFERPKAMSDAAALEAALHAVAGAERPLLILGGGAFYADAEKPVARFLDLTQIPVMVPIWDRSQIARGSANFMGVAGAASGEPDLVSAADVLVVMGARPDYRVGYAVPPGVLPDCTVIAVGVDAIEVAQFTSAAMRLMGDPSSVLDAWSDVWERNGFGPHSDWLREARERERRFRARWSDLPEAPPLTGQHVVEAIRPFLTEDTLFLVDGGNIGQWAHMCLGDGYPENWLTCGASGVVGWGLGGAMGARAAYPDRPIILLSGDGSIGFTLTEIESATRQGLPFVVVLADDSAWGIVVSGQGASYGPEGILASRLSDVRYDLVAEGLGAIGVRAESVGDIRAAIRRGLAESKPLLVHVPIQGGGPADG